MITIAAIAIIITQASISSRSTNYFYMGVDRSQLPPALCVYWVLLGGSLLENLYFRAGDFVLYLG